MYGVLVFLQPELLWRAVVTLIIGCILSAELLNTALENLMDKLHPEAHDAIKLVKDCAAGSVLILSFASTLIFLFLILTECF